MPLLRRLRQISLFRQDTIKYLRYAIGEILLIVIGILIAVWINTRVGYQKERELEKRYLENVREDLLNEDDSYTFGFIKRFDDKIKGLELARQFATGQFEIVDTTHFLKTIGKGGIGSRGQQLSGDATYKDLVSTGNLQLIRNQALKRKIQNYYSGREFLDNYRDNLRSKYANFTNSVRPYNPLDSTDIKAIPPGYLDHLLKTPEFLAQVNEEYTYAYSSLRYILEQIEISRALMEEIEIELRAGS